MGQVLCKLHSTVFFHLQQDVLEKVAQDSLSSFRVSPIPRSFPEAHRIKINNSRATRNTIRHLIMGVGEIFLTAVFFLPRENNLILDSTLANFPKRIQDGDTEIVSVVG